MNTNKQKPKDKDVTWRSRKIKERVKAHWNFGSGSIKGNGGVYSSFVLMIIGQRLSNFGGDVITGCSFVKKRTAKRFSDMLVSSNVSLALSRQISTFRFRSFTPDTDYFLKSLRAH